MVSCGQFKMLPMAPSTFIGLSSTSASPNAKPKIGFSIDSIVGSNGLRISANNSLSPHSGGSPERPSSSCSDADCTNANLNLNYPLELRNSDFRVNPNETNNLRVNQNFDKTHNCRNSYDSVETKDQPRKDSCSSPVLIQSPVSSNRSTTTRTPSPLQQLPPTSAPNISTEKKRSNNKTPIVVPGIPAGLLRPFPVQPPNLGNLKGIPPYFSNPEAGPPNPHFLAAQFQMAAALAHHHGQGGPVGFPPGMSMGQHHPPPFGSHGMVRDSYQLYPWLLSRHGRIFPHRFPGNFLLQPFRKPKRIRTAFSPTQLLKLEHAFEGNHYVVGAERKTLAQTLSLTETQVKVWFQNRRTKHKRMQQEEDGKGGSGSGDQKTGNLNDSTQNSFEEDDEEDEDEDDEVIDMDECPSDQEVEQYHQQQQLQQQQHQQIQQQLSQQQHPYFIHHR